jgi:hypothetical protein
VALIKELPKNPGRTMNPPLFLKSVDLFVDFPFLLYIHSSEMAASGIAVGINKGHIVTRRTLKAKPSNKIGVRI